jgi:hypothetical protein
LIVDADATAPGLAKQDGSPDKRKEQGTGEK